MECCIVIGKYDPPPKKTNKFLLQFEEDLFAISNPQESCPSTVFLHEERQELPVEW